MFARRLQKIDDHEIRQCQHHNGVSDLCESLPLDVEFLIARGNRGRELDEGGGGRDIGKRVAGVQKRNLQRKFGAIGRK